MKRRRFMQALMAAPAAPALLAQQAAAPVPPPPAVNPDALPKLDFSVGEEGADPVPNFFDLRQAAALRRLCDLMAPAAPGTIGALNARVPEFMDFLIGRSPADRQQVWLTGLDALTHASQIRFQKPFADTDDAQADTLMAPLREAWTYDAPTDPIARLLRAAKQDIRTATANSLERSIATSGRQRGRGQQYWLPQD